MMRIEHLRSGLPIPASIHIELASWFAGIGKLQKSRQDEITNAANRHYSHSPHQQKERGTENLIVLHIMLIFRQNAEWPFCLMSSPLSVVICRHPSQSERLKYLTNGLTWNQQHLYGHPHRPTLCLYQIRHH